MDSEQSIEKLLSIFPELNREIFFKRLNSDKNFKWIKRDITPQEYEKIYNLDIPRFGFEKEQKKNIWV